VGCCSFRPALSAYYSRPGAGLIPTLAQAQSGRYIEVAGTSYHMMVIYIIPVVCYPLGFMILERAYQSESGWDLLSSNGRCSRTLVRSGSVSSSGGGESGREMAPLRLFIGVTCCNFLVLRAGWIAYGLQSRIWPGRSGDLPSWMPVCAIDSTMRNKLATSIAKLKVPKG